MVGPGLSLALSMYVGCLWGFGSGGGASRANRGFRNTSSLGGAHCHPIFYTLILTMIQFLHGVRQDKHCHEKDIGLSIETSVSSPRLYILGRINTPISPEVFLGNLYC